MRASQERSSVFARIASSAFSASARLPASSRSAARANPGVEVRGGGGGDISENKRGPKKKDCGRKGESVHLFIGSSVQVSEKGAASRISDDPMTR